MKPKFKIGDLVHKKGGNVLWIVIATANDGVVFGQHYKPEFRRLAANSSSNPWTRDATRTGDVAGRYFLQSSFRVVGRIDPEHIALIHLGAFDLIPEYHLAHTNPDFLTGKE